MNVLAIHGKSFIPSGKRAMRLIWTNFLDIISLDCMNALVHTFVSVIIMLISSLIGFAIISVTNICLIYIIYYVKFLERTFNFYYNKPLNWSLPSWDNTILFFLYFGCKIFLFMYISYY